MLFNLGKAFRGLTAAFSHGKAKMHPDPPFFFADNSRLETSDTKPAKIVQTCSKSRTQMNGRTEQKWERPEATKEESNFVTRTFV